MTSKLSLKVMLVAFAGLLLGAAGPDKLPEPAPITGDSATPSTRDGYEIGTNQPKTESRDGVSYQVVLPAWPSSDSSLNSRISAPLAVSAHDVSGRNDGPKFNK